MSQNHEQSPSAAGTAAADVVGRASVPGTGSTGNAPGGEDALTAYRSTSAPGLDTSTVGFDEVDDESS